MVEKASPVLILKSLEMARLFADAGVAFVCIPVESEAHFDEAVIDIAGQIEALIEKAESEEDSHEQHD